MSYATDKMHRIKKNHYDAKRCYIKTFTDKHGHPPNADDLSHWEKRYAERKKRHEERIASTDSFGARLRYVMACKGITNLKLAGDIYVSKLTVASWKNNKSYPSIPTLVILSNYLDVSIDYLLKGVE